jgi:hypothetical protein
LDHIRERLAQFEGVDKVEANPMTGSLLILHHKIGEEIIQRAEADDLLAFSLVEEELQNIRELVATAAGDLDRKIRTATRGALDLRAIVALVLTIAAGKQIVRRNMWPAASTLLQYATNLVQSGDTVPAAAQAIEARAGRTPRGPRMLRIN